MCRFGPKDVKAIANHVGTRSATQVRTHAQKYFIRLVRTTCVLCTQGSAFIPVPGSEERHQGFNRAICHCQLSRSANNKENVLTIATARASAIAKTASNRTPCSPTRESSRHLRRRFTLLVPELKLPNLLLESENGYKIRLRRRSAVVRCCSPRPLLQ